MRLSHSKIDCFRVCRRKYWHRYIKRSHAAEVPALQLGSAIHKALEKFHHCELAGETMGEAKSKAIVKLTSLPSAAYDKGLGMLESYIASRYRAKVDEIYDIECEIDLDIGDHNLIGYVDRLDRVNGGIRVIDYKSNQNISTSAELDDDVQMRIYALAIMRDEGVAEVETTHHWLRHDVQTTRRRTLKECEDIVPWLRARAREMTEDKTYPAILGSHCAYCPYSEQCGEIKEARGLMLEGVNRPDDLDEMAKLLEVAKAVKSTAEAEVKAISSKLKEALEQRVGGRADFGGRTYHLRSTKRKKYHASAIDVIAEALGRPVLDIWAEVAKPSVSAVKKLCKEHDGSKGQFSECLEVRLWEHRDEFITTSLVVEKK